MAYLFKKPNPQQPTSAPASTAPALAALPPPPPPPPPQIKGPQAVNPGFQIQQNLDPATDPMLAAIGGTVPTGPKLMFTPTQEQADAAWQFQNAPITAYNQQAAAFNKKNAKKIAKGKVQAMEIKQSFARPTVDSSMSYDISQYNPYDPYGIMNQMAMSSPAATGIAPPKKQSKYAPVNPFMMGTPEYAMWAQTYGMPATKSSNSGGGTGGGIYAAATRQYGNEY